jgi:hypothetical protein
MFDLAEQNNYLESSTVLVPLSTVDLASTKNTWTEVLVLGSAHKKENSSLWERLIISLEY